MEYDRDGKQADQDVRNGLIVTLVIIAVFVVASILVGKA